ncbi:OX-2 membrane glyco -like [Pelobates cultripes]|uniref:OX-2 membrane glyco -like n=1 Tax=Pelobates cultripes TaxID=61616 RepID=A0AAD1VLK0_PELCU|nr:OX-2 membrane glyco -like [Pelobates cultripes]
MRCLWLLLCLFHSVFGSLKVISMEKQLAAVGHDVTLECQLIASTKPDVQQVSWKKESGDNVGPVATSSKSFGKRYIGYYSNRIANFTEITPNVSAITIRSVDLEDQGCFKCIFNIFPLGAMDALICLDVYEMNISEPNLEVYPMSSTSGLNETYIITCSVTGRPAPSIEWSLPYTSQEIPQTYTIEHPDHSVTVISNFTQRLSRHQRDTTVTCTIYHPALKEATYLTKSIDSTREEIPLQDIMVWVWPITVIFIILVLIVFIITCQGYIKPHKYQKCTAKEFSSSETAMIRPTDNSTCVKNPILILCP